MFLTRSANYPQQMSQILEVSIILEVQESGTYLTNLSNGGYKEMRGLKTA